MLWVAQVHAPSCIRTTCADPRRLQLASLFRVVSTRNVRCSLRHPSGLVSHPIRLLCRQYHGSNRLRHRPTRPAPPPRPLALDIDVACPFRCRARRCRIWAVHGCCGTGLHRYRTSDRPRHSSTRPARPLHPLSLYLEMTCSGGSVSHLGVTR